MTHAPNLSQVELERVIRLVKRVHQAKGRYHTQIAMCDLFEAVGLPATRPSQEDPIMAAKAQPDTSVTNDRDPCPGCRKEVVCRTPKCGRLAMNRASAPFLDDHESLTFHPLEKPQ